MTENFTNLSVKFVRAEVMERNFLLWSRISDQKENMVPFPMFIKLHYKWMISFKIFRIPSNRHTSQHKCHTWK